MVRSPAVSGGLWFRVRSVLRPPPPVTQRTADRQ